MEIIATVRPLVRNYVEEGKLAKVEDPRSKEEGEEYEGGNEKRREGKIWPKLSTHIFLGQGGG